MNDFPFYKIPIPISVLKTFASGQIVILEKIIAPDDSDVAAGLIENKQPTYYFDNDFYMSNVLYMNDIEGEYTLNLIRIDENIVNGAQNIRDYGIDLYNTHLYAYRFRHIIPILQQDNTYKYDEFITRYKYFKKVKDIYKLENVYANKHRLHQTVRNIAYRGRNDVNKYNMSLLEINSDLILLNRNFDNVNNQIENFKLTDKIFYQNIANDLIYNATSSVPVFFLDYYTPLYNCIDTIKYLKQLKES